LNFEGKTLKTVDGSKTYLKNIDPGGVADIPSLKFYDDIEPEFQRILESFGMIK
jgi:hypothetical protein